MIESWYGIPPLVPDQVVKWIDNLHGQDFFKREEDFFEFLASAASIVSCFGRTEGHTLDLCVKVVSLEFFTHTHRGAKEKKKTRVRENNELLHN